MIFRSISTEPSHTRRSLSARPHTPLTGMVYPADSLRLRLPMITGSASLTGVLLTGDQCTESPFASSGGYPSECRISCNIDWRYPVIIAHTGSCARPKPSCSLGLCLALQVFAGCCAPLLGVGPSRRYLRNLYIGAWTLTP